MRFTLTYDLEPWGDETSWEEFDTVEELLERYEEIKWEFYEIRAWDEEEEIRPWFKK